MAPICDIEFDQVWPERVLGAVFGDPAKLWEYDPDEGSSETRRKK